MYRLLEKILEARGHWRNWSTLECQNPDCPWRDYQKNFAKRGEKIPEVCPECGGELKLEESIGDVNYGAKVSGGWLKPDGSIENLTFMYHAEDAARKMRKLTGKRYTNSHKAFLDLMKLKGYIAIDEEYPDGGVDISVKGRVTPAQLTAIEKVVKDTGSFYYSLYIKPGKVEHGESYSKFVEALRSYELIESIKESSIDFPREDLDTAVWEKSDDIYVLREEVKSKIIGLISKYPDKDLNEIAKEIHIVGSMTTNQYGDDADVDVHIIPEDISEWSEGDVNAVVIWFNEHRDELDGYVNKHPIEVYIQLDPNQDLMSDGCYDILSNKWLIGPKIVPIDLDPYEDFSHIADEIRNVVEDADVLFGELKRDVIDYEVIQTAMQRMSGENRERLLKKLEDKLKELEDDIEALYKKRGEWVDARHKASKPKTPEQALKDVELAKKWRDTNAIFKFVNRYHYLRTISNLRKLLADEKVTPDEVDKIKSIMKGVTG